MHDRSASLLNPHNISLLLRLGLAQRKRHGTTRHWGLEPGGRKCPWSKADLLGEGMKSTGWAKNLCGQQGARGGPCQRQRINTNK